jgi:tetratricopeptide (TPR) repeat protein
MIPLFVFLSVILIVSIIGGISGIFWWRQRNDLLAMTQYDHGVSYLQAGEYPKAIEAFSMALKRKKDLIDARYGLGLTYLQQQRYYDGIKMLEPAMKEMADNAIAHYNLGRAYINVGNLDEALRVLNTALKLSPDVKEIHFNLARVFQEQGKIEQAKKYCQQALKLDSNYTRAKDYLEFLSGIRYVNPVNLDAIRQALKNFDAGDTEFMLSL